MAMRKAVCSTSASRLLIALFSVGMVFFFWAGSAYSGLRVSDQRMIRIAYANGYKDALLYAAKLEHKKLAALINDREQFKTQVLYAADAYVDKVSGLNK